MIYKPYFLIVVDMCKKFQVEALDIYLSVFSTYSGTITLEIPGIFRKKINLTMQENV